MKIKIKSEIILLDDEHWDFLKWFTWRVVYPYKQKYAVTGCPTWLGNPGKNVRMHTLVVHVLNKKLKNRHYVIDHIDGNGLNNQTANLRLVTQSQNLYNTRTDARQHSSMYKGVCKHKNSPGWVAQIVSQRHKIYIGVYKTEEEAAMAYDRAAIARDGKCVRTNFPQEKYGIKS